MLKTNIAHFQALRPPVKAMVYLHWIYGFVGSLTGMFVHIYLYQRFESVLFNIVGGMFYFIGCALGFSLIGVAVGHYRLNMKWGYLWAFVILCASFFLLFGEVTRHDALWFLFVNGIGLGLYWLTLHTFELTETKDHERDYYSSVLSAGDQIIELAAPALATALFYLSDDVFHLGSFTLLFAFSPIIYLAGLPFLRPIRDYRPEPVEWSDVHHFFHDRRNRHAQLYLFAGSLNFTLIKVALPIAAILFLGSAKDVGVFNSLFAVVSAVTLMFLSRYRHGGRRMQFLFWTSAASAAMALFVAVRFDLIAFVIFSLCAVILKPLMRVSAHVIDLETMETLGKEGRDFFPTMVLRDAAFGVWRVLALLAFAMLVLVVGGGAAAVQVSFVVIALSYVLLWLGARLIYRKG
jgi:hypothetical protein